MSDKICECPKCGKKFKIINPYDRVNTLNLPVIDCNCGEMLEYSTVTEKLELV